MADRERKKRVIPASKSDANKKRVPRWELTTDLFEIHWVKDVRGKIYADKVRICGCLFFAAVYGDPISRHRNKKGGRA